MGGLMQLLLDTNIVIAWTNGHPAVMANLEGKQLGLSVISQIELLAYPTLKQAETQLIKNILSFLQVYTITPSIVEATVEFRKSYNIKLPDAIIAATAFSLKCPLYTFDKGFNKIQEISSLN
jgi:predicted nucleic acid-binding protein